MTIEELLESATFKKFNSSIEYVFDTAEEIDFGSIDEGKLRVILNTSTGKASKNS